MQKLPPWLPWKKQRKLSKKNNQFNRLPFPEGDLLFAPLDIASEM